MKKFFVILQIFLLAVSLGLFMSVPETKADNDLKDKIRAMRIDGASSENPVVSLGKKFDVNSWQEVEGFAIVHYANKDMNANTKNFRDLFAKPSAGSACYGYIASGAKWKSVEPWVIDSMNTAGLNANFLLTNMTQNISKWEDATDGVVGNGLGLNVLGNGSLSSGAIIPSNTLNNLNEVTFAPIQNQGAIAVTYVWGIFGGLTSKRQIVEWDQVYNTAYAWSATGEAGKMDFENIATHELGHSFGLADLYTSKCNQETMYGYASFGQTNKRDLNAGDINGINLFY